MLCKSQNHTAGHTETREIGSRLNLQYLGFPLSLVLPLAGQNQSVGTVHASITNRVNSNHKQSKSDANKGQPTEQNKIQITEIHELPRCLQRDRCREGA